MFMSHPLGLPYRQRYRASPRSGYAAELAEALAPLARLETAERETPADVNSVPATPPTKTEAEVFSSVTGKGWRMLGIAIIAAIAVGILALVVIVVMSSRWN